MTCIVGMEYDNKVYMGCDSAAVDSNLIQPSRCKKVFRVGPYLIGYTSSFRMGQLLQYNLKVIAEQGNEEDLEHLVTNFIPVVRRCLRSGGFLHIEDNEELSGTFLLGYKGSLYEIGEDFQVNSFSDGIASIGCGCEYALGAMSVLKTKPKSRITAALKAAGRFSTGVCGPYYISVQ